LGTLPLVACFAGALLTGGSAGGFVLLRMIRSHDLHWARAELTRPGPAARDDLHEADPVPPLLARLHRV
jgi:hypothetical protein